jgi:hypothetical protein
VVGSVEIIQIDVPNLTEMNVYTVPLPYRFKITDLIIANGNASPNCCARIFTGPLPCIPQPSLCAERTGYIAVPAGGMMDHSFVNGINFNGGQVVTVRNGDAVAGPIDFTMRGYLFTIP